VTSAALESLRKSSELRSQTDTQISVAWIILPIASVLLAITVGVLYFIAIVASFSAGIYTPGTIAPVAGGFALIAGLGFLGEILYLDFFYFLRDSCSLGFFLGLIDTIPESLETVILVI